jgi:FlaA1/EpsC-like NDP-sugar epimerase
MARQEQDFNKETNRQVTTVIIKDSSRVTIDLMEYQIAQVFQFLLSLEDPEGRSRFPQEVREKASVLDILSGRSPGSELQDVEVNSLLQRHHVQIENCTDVKISMSQIEVEKVVEAALAVLRQRARQV